MKKRLAKFSEKELIKLRFGLALRKLLQENEEIAETKKGRRAVVNLSQLSSETGLRTASLSSIFNGDSNLSAVSLCTIINALGKTFSDFAKRFEQLSEEDLLNYYEEVQKRKQERTRRITS